MAPKKTDAAAPQDEVVAQVLSANEVNELVEVCLATPMEGYPSKKDDVLWGLPLLIEGKPGIAKSARMKQLAKVLHVKARSLFSAQHPPEDFSGALIPDGHGNAAQICPLVQVRELMKEKYGIIHLDELNGAPPATQGALQSFIHERVAGDQPIPGRIRIVASQNSAEIATGGFPLSIPLANRFVHLTDPGPTSRDWMAWLMGNTSNRKQATMEQIEDTIVEDWPNIFPESQALFAGFMERHGEDLLHKMPEVGDPQGSKAWPSHRTWDYAIRAFTTARIMEKNDSIRDAVIEACVGPGAAAVFLTYMNDTKIPTPMDVLDGKFNPDKDRLDIIMAAYTGAVAFVRQRPSQKEKFELGVKAWSSLKKLFPLNLADIAVPASEGLVQERLGRAAQDPDLKKAASEVLILLAKSGVQSFVEERST